jgi:hypothetical protein
MALSLKVRRRVALVLAVVLPLGAVVLWRFEPTTTAWFPKCAMYTSTGLHCPGCGTARCLHALAHGHVLQAIAYNAVTVAFLPVLAIWLARQVWAVVRGTDPPPRRWLTPRGCWVVVALIIAFGVLRNVPVYPFTLLAPHELGSSSEPRTE